MTSIAILVGTDKGEPLPGTGVVIRRPLGDSEAVQLTAPTGAKTETVPVVGLVDNTPITCGCKSNKELLVGGAGAGGEPAPLEGMTTLPGAELGPCVPLLYTGMTVAWYVVAGVRPLMATEV